MLVFLLPEACCLAEEKRSQLIFCFGGDKGTHLVTHLRTTVFEMWHLLTNAILCALLCIIIMKSFQVTIMHGWCTVHQHRPRISSQSGSVTVGPVPQARGFSVLWYSRLLCQSGGWDL